MHSTKKIITKARNDKNTKDITLKPNLTFLSKEDKDKINQAALQILAEIGMVILHAEALDILKDAGCELENENLVKIPESLVHHLYPGFRE